MRALIMAAGHGKRLRPITWFIHKLNLKILGENLINCAIDYLHLHGVTEIYVNLHHLPVSIMKTSNDRAMYFYEPELLGEEKSIDKLIALAPSLSNDYLVVMNGDTLTNLDLSMMFRMSNGRSIQFMDGDTYAGVKILSPKYLRGEDKKIANYYTSAWWQDCGTFKGYWKALKYVEKADKRYQDYKINKLQNEN